MILTVGFWCDCIPQVLLGFLSVEITKVCVCIWREEDEIEEEETEKEGVTYCKQIPEAPTHVRDPASLQDGLECNPGVKKATQYNSFDKKGIHYLCKRVTYSLQRRRAEWNSMTATGEENKRKDFKLKSESTKKCGLLNSTHVLHVPSRGIHKTKQQRRERMSIKYLKECVTSLTDRTLTSHSGVPHSILMTSPLPCFAAQWSAVLKKTSYKWRKIE